MDYIRQNLLHHIENYPKLSTEALVEVISNLIGYCFTGELTYEMIDSFYQLYELLPIRYCKSFIFGGYFYFALLMGYKQKLPKYKAVKHSF